MHQGVNAAAAESHTLSRRCAMLQWWWRGVRFRRLPPVAGSCRWRRLPLRFRKRIHRLPHFQLLTRGARALQLRVNREGIIVQSSGLVQLFCCWGIESKQARKGRMVGRAASVFDHVLVVIVIHCCCNAVVGRMKSMLFFLKLPSEDSSQGKVLSRSASIRGKLECVDLSLHPSYVAKRVRQAVG